ncbi:MAG: NAD-dependent deacylase [Candidatus Latescibacteria bacterium]|nr:NAD-dependent deacylase [Candidatus Latescibacterota bacterium]
MTSALRTAVEFARAARRVVVTTGAGMSKESGIPTFRDAPNALWANYNVEDLATRGGFRRDPALVWRWYAERRTMIAAARPHEGHIALARWEERCDSFVVLTQNIDGLHAAAGSKNVVELHGNIFRYTCFDRGHDVEGPFPQDATPPRCACGSLVRPAVVWFGESLDPAHLETADAALSSCDVLVVVGTSGLVYPAAGFALTARERGARVIEVNPEQTPLTEIADVFVPGGARTILPELVPQTG